MVNRLLVSAPDADIQPPKKRARLDNTGGESSRAGASTNATPAKGKGRQGPIKGPIRSPHSAIRAAYQSYASEGVIPNQDAIRALKALGYPLPPADFFEDGDDSLTWVEFRDLALAMFEQKEEDDQDDQDDEAASNFSRDSDVSSEDYVDEDTAEAEAAFNLFLDPKFRATQNLRQSAAGEPRITLADLKRIARQLKEDVDDSTLALMISEANGEPDIKAAARQGVTMSQFAEVARRAGVLK